MLRNVSAAFFEAGVSLLLFGSLSERSELRLSGEAAVQELRSKGYQFSMSEPIRIYPLDAGTTSGEQAGAWQPGIIRLRSEVQGSDQIVQYLRHELMHEASFRTCKGRARSATWIEEGRAIAFSGEGRGSDPPTPEEIDRLKRSIQFDAPLNNESYKTLVKLIGHTGWNVLGCDIPHELADRLKSKTDDGTFSFILIHMLSGRVLESGGDIRSRYPVGSLLKIPYVASFANNDAVIDDLLLRSDTERLIALSERVNADRFQLLFQQEVAVRNTASEDWLPFVGGRGPKGTYPLLYSLSELAWLLRASLLLSSDRFEALSKNGQSRGSTLEKAHLPSLKLLRGLDAIAKTGTASNIRGEPLTGHLMVAWPSKNPYYLAIGRVGGVRGAGVLPNFDSLLARWKSEYREDNATVRVEILSLLSPDKISVHYHCPQFEIAYPLFGGGKATRCGKIDVQTAAQGAKHHRELWGVLDTQLTRPVLITDPGTYADGVIQSEADDLRGEARKALRAVIEWDGLHGSSRHPKPSALCDATHCMVFQGAHNGHSNTHERSDPKLHSLLDEISKRRKMFWFPFSRGGYELWTKKFDQHTISALANEGAVIAVERERVRSGEVVFHLVYSGGDETVPCEVLRTALHLPSCPDSVISDNGSFHFQGRGKGHGEGLATEEAAVLARSGLSAAEILSKSYDH